MREVPRSDTTDGISWKCAQCKSRKSIRDGSFFTKSRLTLQQWLMQIFFWVDEEAVTRVCEHCDTHGYKHKHVSMSIKEVCSIQLQPSVRWGRCGC